MTDKTMLEWVGELRECDHCFVSAEGIQMFADAFGVTLTPTYQEAEPDQPKGLVMNDRSEGAVGMDAAELAEKIAAKVAGFRPYQMGRGFRLRSACDALERHYKA